jgi:Cof subfamily protein (haloacid dehalogenase superfamily)
MEREEMNRIKLIVTDLDDTLLRRDKTISDYTIDVFKQAKKHGLLVAFATARSLDDSRDYRVVLNPDGDIVTGGCLIFVGSQLLSSNYLPEQQGACLLTELCSHPLVKSVSARSLNTRYSNIPIEGRICIDFSSPLPDKLLHCSFRTDDGTIVTSIAKRYPEFLFLHVSGSDLYDINPQGATKLNGVKTLLNYYSIDLSEVVAFGDDYNDIEMLRECGIGVAMRNSIDECKAVANYICGDCDEDGVAKWIEENIL